MNAEASVFEEKALNSQTFLLAAKPGLLLDRASFSLKLFIFFQSLSCFISVSTTTALQMPFSR